MEIDDLDATRAAVAVAALATFFLPPTLFNMPRPNDIIQHRSQAITQLLIFFYRLYVSV